MTKLEEISSRDLMKGDTFLDDGHMKTVGKTDIKYFAAVRPFTVQRVLFPKFYLGKIIRYQTQILN